MILILGGSGRLGSRVLRQLLEKGEKPRALLRRPQALPEGVEKVYGDLSQPDTLAQAFAGVERVFVLAPPTPEMEWLERNAFEAAVRASVQRIVYLSNFGAGQFPGTVWEAHGRNEQRLRHLDLAWTILRPVRFTSDTPFPWSWREGVLREALGQQSIPLIDPDDIAAAACLALLDPGHHGKIYELSTHAMTGAQLAAKLGGSYQSISPEEGAADALLAGAPPFVAETVATYYRTVLDGLWSGPVQQAPQPHSTHAT